MPKQLKVTYQLNPVQVENQVADYSDLGVSLFYEENKIVRVEHTLDADDSTTDTDAIAISEERLKLFWELLQYKRGVPIPRSNYTVEQIAVIPGEPVARTGIATALATAALANSIGMPDPALFTQSDSRLIVWLRLANDARNAAVDADAIRNYYMIWEDRNGRPDSGKAPDAAVNLRLVRNFVSHGGDLTDNDLLNLVEGELGVRATRYDPTDSAQQRFVQKYRQIGRELIERELAPLV